MPVLLSSNLLSVANPDDFRGSTVLSSTATNLDAALWVRGKQNDGAEIPSNNINRKNTTCEYTQNSLDRIVRCQYLADPWRISDYRQCWGPKISAVDSRATCWALEWEPFVKCLPFEF